MVIGFVSMLDSTDQKSFNLSLHGRAAILTTVDLIWMVTPTQDVQ
jgi:hypothetical protein